MPVRTVRLPDHLWQRLGARQAEINKGRTDPVSLSSVVRVLLEQALAANLPIDFEGDVVRPPRIYRDRAAKLAKSNAQIEAPTIFRKANDLFEVHAITPPIFHAAIGGERADAQRFFHAGKLPEQDAAGFLERVKAWIRTYEV